MKYKLGFVFIISGIYAILRYHIFGPVLIKDLFLFTFNKIFIFSAVIFMVFSVLSSKKEERKIFARWVILLLSMHILSSIVLLKPYYFSDFFTKGKGFSIKANLVLLGGIVGAALMFLKNKNLFPKNIYNYLLFIFLSLHLISMGIKGWLKPLSWYGYMPPITLVSFFLILFWFYRKE